MGMVDDQTMLTDVLYNCMVGRPQFMALWYYVKDDPEALAKLQVASESVSGRRVVGLGLRVGSASGPIRATGAEAQGPGSEVNRRGRDWQWGWEHTQATWRDRWEGRRGGLGLGRGVSTPQSTPHAN